MKNIQASTLATLKKYGVKKASLFGSYSRGEETNSSDVDILIEPPSNMGLFTFVRLKSDLENVLHKKVDLVVEEALKPSLRYVKREAVYAEGI